MKGKNYKYFKYIHVYLLYQTYMQSQAFTVHSSVVKWIIKLLKNLTAGNLTLM